MRPRAGHGRRRLGPAGRSRLITSPPLPTIRGMARVLIVEDDAAIGQVLQRSLQLEGYEVAVAPDGVARSSARMTSSRTP